MRVLLTLLILLTAANLCPAAQLTVVNDANPATSALAPESIASATLDTALPAGDVSVTVTDSAGVSRPAVILYTSPILIIFQIPPGAATGMATVAVGSGGSTVAQASISIASVAPGLFAGNMNVIVTAPDGSQTVSPVFYYCVHAVCLTGPVNLGPVGSQTALALFGTGIRGRSGLDNVTCTVAGQTVQVSYAGPAPGFTGLDQVNIGLPLSLPSGNLSINLTVDSQPANTVFLDIVGLAPAGRAAWIVSQMTLDEKISQLHGIQDADDYRTVPGLPRLGIPTFNITNGPAGVANGGPGHQGPATALPAPIALAATFDPSAARNYGLVIGREAAALNNNLVEGPDINIARVPQNGRTFEAFGEDPFLVGQIAAAEIGGIQQFNVIAESKHFAGNNQETNRSTINDIIDERTLREIYLPAFEYTVKSGVGAVMCAYNKVNGVYNCEDDLLMNQIVKGEWGFQGLITSDFGAVHSTVPSALAGLDLEMPTGIYFDSALKAAVNAGQVPMSVIDDKLIRRFTTTFGLQNTPPQPSTDDPAYALNIAIESMVLLKNDGNVLPLARGGNIALIGPYSTAAMTGGGGSSQVTPSFTTDPASEIGLFAGSVTTSDGSNLTQAAALAKTADVAVVMIGDTEAEGSDHLISLSGNQDQLVQTVVAANPHTVVVVKSGSAVLMPWVKSVPAILEAWYPGQEDGRAVAQMLFGFASPSGKLPLTFPVNVADLPANTPAQYPGVNNVANYSEGVFVGYRHFDASNIEPLFPFGFGLSYTTFTYSNLTLTSTAADFDITNSGTIAGAEVAQLYVGMPPSQDVPQPPKQLKGFQRILLDPGATGHVHIPLDARSFSYWDVASHSWQIAPGTHQIMLGSSSRDIRLQGALNF